MEKAGVDWGVWRDLFLHTAKKKAVCEVAFRVFPVTFQLFISRRKICVRRWRLCLILDIFKHFSATRTHNSDK